MEEPAAIGQVNMFLWPFSELPHDLRDAFTKTDAIMKGEAKDSLSAKIQDHLDTLAFIVQYTKGASTHLKSALGVQIANTCKRLANVRRGYPSPLPQLPPEHFPHSGKHLIGYRLGLF